jgi:hypothetical protein
MPTWTLHLHIGGYDAATHHQPYAAAADWLEEWLADTAEDVTWTDDVEEDTGEMRATAELVDLRGDPMALVEGVENLFATVEQAGMVPLSATIVDPTGLVVPLLAEGGDEVPPPEEIPPAF